VGLVVVVVPSEVVEAVVVVDVGADEERVDDLVVAVVLSVANAEREFNVLTLAEDSEEVVSADLPAELDALTLDVVASGVFSPEGVTGLSEGWDFVPESWFSGGGEEFVSSWKFLVSFDWVVTTPFDVSSWLAAEVEAPEALSVETLSSTGF
jgi:hypothetical protein